MRNRTTCILMFVVSLLAMQSDFAMGESPVANEKPIDRKLDENGRYHIVYDPDPRVSDDIPARAEVWGTSCDDMKGKLYSPEGKKPWHEGDLYCLPYVKDVQKYIRSSFAYINSQQIMFRNGPALLKQEDQALSREEYIQDVLRRTASLGNQHGKTLEEKFALVPKDARIVGFHFYKVKSIQECGTDGDVFCATIDRYEPDPKLNKTFQVFCWDCEPLRSSPEQLQESILFERSGYGLLLDGGIAFEFETHAAQYIPQLREILTSEKGETDE